MLRLLLALLVLCTSTWSTVAGDIALATERPGTSLQMAEMPSAAELVSCGLAPDRRCVLQMAVSAAESIDEKHGRESALVRVSDAQAAAGQFEQALATAEKIENVAYRLSPSPLARIALAQSAVGSLEQAAATARRLKIDFHRVSVLTRVVEVAAPEGDREAIRDVLTAALLEAQQIEDRSFRPVVLARLARSAAMAGNRDLAEAAFEAALNAADEERSAESRESALAHIAEAQADAGQIGEALATLSGVRYPWKRWAALVAIARAQAVAGDVKAALATAEGIDDQSAQVDAFVRIAEARATRGDVDPARQALLLALATADSIPIGWEETPFVTAIVAIVGAQAAMGDIESAVETYRAIGDDSFRGTALSQIAATPVMPRYVDRLQAPLGDAGDRLAKALTLAATSRANADMGDIEAARQMSDAALRAVAEVDDPEERAYVLRSIGATKARIGDVDGVAATIAAVGPASKHVEHAGMLWPAFLDRLWLAEALARNGEVSGALTTAATIDNVHWYVKALIAIAGALSR